MTFFNSAHVSYIFLLNSFAVLSDPDKRLDYDFTGIYEIDKYTLRVRTFFYLFSLSFYFDESNHLWYD